MHQMEKLPFEIPSSMNEVRNQFEDVPDDTKNPTFESWIWLNLQIVF